MAYSGTTQQPQNQCTSIAKSTLNPKAPSTQRHCQSYVPLTAIHVSQQQPRRYFDPGSMAQLIESIRTHGILENLVVMQVSESPKGYKLIAGERRYRAARSIGLAEVPVTIVDLESDRAWEVALVENLQRESLNPLEEVEAILQLLALRLQVSPEQVPSILYRLQHEVRGQVSPHLMSSIRREIIEGVFTQLGSISWESFVSNRLPLLKLPEEIKQVLRTGQIAYTKAIAIARLKDPSRRQALLAEAIASNLTLSQIRCKIRQAKTKEKAPSLAERTETALRRLQQTRVWQNPHKREQLEQLLSQIEALLAEE